MAICDPRILDYMDPYDVQVLTDAIFERIGKMIVDEISTNKYSNDNNHIPSSLAVYNYLKNNISVADSSSSGNITVSQKTTTGNVIASINGTDIYNGVTASNGKGLINILTGIPTESSTVTAPAGATQYVYFIIGDGVTTGGASSGSCTSGQTISISYTGNAEYKIYVCMFFG